VNVDSGELLSHDGQAAAFVHRDEGGGVVSVSATRPPATRGVDGQGALCTFTFKTLAAGTSQLTLIKVGATDSNHVSLPASAAPGVVHVK